jgi:hypothetical protein
LPPTSTSIRRIGKVRFVRAIGSAVRLLVAQIRPGVAQITAGVDPSVASAVWLLFGNHAKSVLTVAAVRTVQVQAGIVFAESFDAGLAHRAIDPGAGVSHTLAVYA